MVGGAGGHPQGIASACAHLKSEETGEVGENLQVHLGKFTVVLRTLVAWLLSAGCIVLTVNLFFRSANAATNVEELLSTGGMFVSCGCGLVLFLLGLIMRPSADEYIDVKPRKHGFSNRSSSGDGVAMVADFTSGAKGGTNANALSAALGEHYGNFGVGYDVRVVGEQRDTKTREQNIVDMGTYHVAPKTSIHVETPADNVIAPSEEDEKFWPTEATSESEEQPSEDGEIDGEVIDEVAEEATEKDDDDDAFRISF